MGQEEENSRSLNIRVLWVRSLEREALGGSEVMRQVIERRELMKSRMRFEEIANVGKRNAGQDFGESPVMCHHQNLLLGACCFTLRY